MSQHILMPEPNQATDSVVATPRASNDGSIFWVTPTQFNPQTGTYQTHYYANDLVRSGTVSVGTPTWKNSSVPRPTTNFGRPVAAPILIPPPSRNLANFEDPVVRIPEGIRELDDEDDDNQSVVDIKQLGRNYDSDSENGDNGNRAKSVVDVVVALGHVLVKDLQKAVPTITQNGNALFESCLAAPNANDEMIFSSPIRPNNTRKHQKILAKPHLLPYGLTLQEAPANSTMSLDTYMSQGLSASTLESDMFYDQSRYPPLNFILYDNLAGNLFLDNQIMKKLVMEFGDSPLCFISLINCPDKLFKDFLLAPDPNIVEDNLNSPNNLGIGRSNKLNICKIADLYYWCRDEEFIYILLDFNLDKIPKYHDVLVLFANMISSCIIFNNKGVINQNSLLSLKIISDLQQGIVIRQNALIDQLLNPEESHETNPNGTPNHFNIQKDSNVNPLLLLTPRFKPNMNLDYQNNGNNENKEFSENQNSEEREIDHLNLSINETPRRNLLCTLKTNPRPSFIWLLHDFNYILYDNNVIWSSVDYLETLLNELGCGYECPEDQMNYFEILKTNIRSFYSMKECHVLVSPFKDSKKVSSQKLGNDYVRQVLCIRQRILGLSKNQALRHKLGQYNSSGTINRYTSVFFEILKKNSQTNIADINVDIQNTLCSNILTEINEYFISELRREINDILPIKDTDIKDKMNEIESKCMYLYKEYTSTLIDTDIYIDNKIKLKNQIKICENKAINENHNIGIKYCNSYIEEITDKTITEKLNSNKKIISMASRNKNNDNTNFYSLIELEHDLEELYTTINMNLSDKLSTEIILDCFLKYANEIRHQWYKISGGYTTDSDTSRQIIASKLNSQNDLTKKIETPEILANRLNACLDDLYTEYNSLNIMQKKELLEDILLEAIKKKDRLGDFYSAKDLCDIDYIINTVQEKLDEVNTERQNILDNEELQRQFILKNKQSKWRRLFSCFYKNSTYENAAMNNTSSLY
ncbi:hypothetical protein ACR3K2_01480 [Cryptosporidium serpentis]